MNRIHFYKTKKDFTHMKKIFLSFCFIITTCMTAAVFAQGQQAKEKTETAKTTKVKTEATKTKAELTKTESTKTKTENKNCGKNDIKKKSCGKK